MLELITGPNNIHLGIFGIVYAAIGLTLCLAIILPKAISEARERDGIRPIRLSLPALVVVIVAAFGMALITTIPPLLIGELGSERANFLRFFYGSGIGTVGILLLIIYKYGGNLERE